MVVKRGDIFYADLDPIIGSEQGGIRPILVVQNNIGNKYSPTLVVLPLSSAKKNNMPKVLLNTKYLLLRHQGKRMIVLKKMCLICFHYILMLIK